MLGIGDLGKIVTLVVCLTGHFSRKPGLKVIWFGYFWLFEVIFNGV